jgi:hypothetical protein
LFFILKFNECGRDRKIKLDSIQFKVLKILIIIKYLISICYMFNCLSF